MPVWCTPADPRQLRAKCFPLFTQQRTSPRYFGMSVSCQVRTSPTERSGGLPSGSDRPSLRATSYLREALKHVAVRVPEENRTMTAWLIDPPSDKSDASA